jgi:hypothetical protein
VKGSGAWKLAGILLLIATVSFAVGYLAMLRFILP